MKRILFLLLIIISTLSLYAGDHSFSVNFELTQTAINRALAQQYNQLYEAFGSRDKNNVCFERKNNVIRYYEFRY